MFKRTPHAFANRWNHNTHYYPLLDSLLPPTGLILDAGCGDGTLAGYLARRPDRRVVGFDVDPDALPARAATTEPWTAFGLGSLTALPLRSDYADAAVLVLSLHHVEAALALPELERVLRPGGRLAVLGIGRSAGLRDLPAELRDALTHRFASSGKQSWEPRTVKSDPPLTWRQTRVELRRYLPEASYRRLPMWRYLAVWDKPV